MSVSTFLLLSFTVLCSSAQEISDNDYVTGQVKPKPVPFGHIFKDGIDDTSSDFKVPYDLLELDMRFPKSLEEERRLLKELPKHRIMKLMNPEDSDHLKPKISDMNDDITFIKRGMIQKDIEDDKPHWFNFEKIQERNVASPRPKVVITTSRNNLVDNIYNLPAQSFVDRKNFFSRNSFDLLPGYGGNDTMNWTTCKEFGKGVSPKNMFHPNDIVDIDWEPFYVWAYRKNVAFNIHRFTFATKKIVQEYKDLYGPYLNSTLDWEQPKLLLREQMEMLLIAADRNGLFRGIPKQNLPLPIRNKKLSLPIINLRLKIVDPYLAMMYCDDFYAVIMAAPGTTPDGEKEKQEEASILKFIGEGYPISKIHSHSQQLIIKSLNMKQKNVETINWY